MKEKIASLSILMNILLAFAKIFVGIVSGASSVFSDGIHSFVDVLSSIICYIGIKVTKKPVDKKHPYGYYKFEVLSSLVITIILLATGLYIIYKSYLAFIKPVQIKYAIVAIITMLISAIINEIMSYLKIKYGKKENSISLLSDGVHSKLDVYGSVAILVGLFFNYFWIYTNALLTLFVGIIILKESFSLSKEALSSLLDISAGEDVENQIKEIVKKRNIELVELKTLKRGSVITANLKIKLPNKLSVEEATKISESLKKDLIKNIENLEYVVIQIESHDFSTNYFKDYSEFGFGRGFGWRHYNQHLKKSINMKLGECYCPNCGYTVEHKKGVPCSSLICPNCKTHLIRKVN